MTSQSDDLLSLKEEFFKNFKLITLELEDKKMNEFSEKDLANVYDYLFHQTNDGDNDSKNEDSNESINDYDENLFMFFAEINKQ